MKLLFFLGEFIFFFKTGELLFEFWYFERIPNDSLIDIVLKILTSSISLKGGIFKGFLLETKQSLICYLKIIKIKIKIFLNFNLMLIFF